MYEVGVLYEALIQVGVNPRQADEMFIWECAMVLGVGREDEAETETTPATPAPTRAIAHGRDLLRQRLAAANGEGPPPEVEAVNPDSLRML